MKFVNQELSWEALYTDLFHCAYSPRSFQANFGCSTAVCVKIWGLLNSRIKPHHLLWTLAFLKSYGTYMTMCLKFDRCNEKTYRTWVWKTIEVLFLQLNNVNLEERLGHPVGQEFFENKHLIIDATACAIERPLNKEDQELYYSGKHKLHCNKWEVGVRVSDGKICWINGPYPGSFHDLSIFEQGHLAKEIGKEENLLGDKGYQSGEKLITPFKGSDLSEEEKAFNALFAKSRIKVERVFGRMKEFSCLVQRWRHDRYNHRIVFCVCAFITNIKLECNPL